MRIFVTGSTGFIGRPTVRELQKRGHKLLLLLRNNNERKLLESKKNLSFIQGDLSDIHKHKKQIARFKPDVLLHLAWEGIPSDDVKINVKNILGGLHCIETLASVGCKAAVVSGSCHEYGEPGVKVNEKFSLQPFNALYASKVALCWLGSKVASDYGMKLFWARIFFVYGPSQRKNSLIPYLLSSIRKGEVPKLRNPKGGNDFIYVGDVARALRMIVEKSKRSPSAVYNIGSGRLVSVAEVVKRVYRFSHRPAPAEIRIPKKVSGFYADISKIKRAVGWRPKFSLDDGIREVLKSQRNIQL